ncbi:venom factor-like [Mobula birostris]|uniref:venom factor-like n=1 Tax=Mobula birostris TaxID=1983395 RepID=UPI003B28335B
MTLARYVMTAPNVLRIESEETVVVEAHNVNFDIKVQIILLLFPEQKISLHLTQINLTPKNDYIASATVKIPADKLPKESSEDLFAALEATSKYFKLKTVILISRQKGYIFIQTDKPIYTPTQTVHYRLYKLDFEMKPRIDSQVVKFVNPQGIVAKEDDKLPQGPFGIVAHTFKIPEIVNIGIWKIVTSYADAPHINFTTQFEVKEYVLPSFDVTLDSEQLFYCINDTELYITVSARYTFGKEVEGIAFILFGVIKDGERLSIPQSLKTVPIKYGHGRAALNKGDLIARFKDINLLVGSSIYVTASVITHTGTDLVVAEKTGIKIVVSPYTILFTKTSRYYKPGMPFDLMVFVVHPDGSPASGIPVKVENEDAVKSETRNDGTAKLTINTFGGQKNLLINVSTEISNTPRNRQASAWMIAEPYLTKDGSANYLHIGISQTNLKLGDDLVVTLNTKTDNQQVKEQIKYFTYLLMSKGRIVKFRRAKIMKEQSIISIQIPISSNLIPSFRLIAYYYIVNGREVEFVADSVWIDVKDTCMGTLKVSVAHEKEEAYGPGDKLDLKVTGDPGARFGLVAVDKAVFSLNKNKIAQNKIWSVVEKNDMGCTAGSGRNFLGVFFDAGLAFVTSTNVKTKTRTELKCQQPNTRKRRAANLLAVKAEKSWRYTDEVLRRCCDVGMKENAMRFSCSKRARHIQLGKACADAFTDCCEHIRQYKELFQRTPMSLARRADEDYYSSNQNQRVRTNFLESWLWNTFHLPQNTDKDGLASMTLPAVLQDTITTWEIQAVSMSPTKGICVAEPYDIRVMKNFYIDLRLPYSAVRNEQVEIRAILYNYNNADIQVRVEFPYNENLCSNAKPTKSYFNRVSIPRQSSTVVSYVIIPLTIGEIQIEVKAIVLHFIVTDAVRKPLRVVPEGVKVDLPVDTYILEPKGEMQVFNISFQVPKNMVPDTPPVTEISVQGELLTEAIENTIEALNLNKLIKVPYGCGEQNMATMTPLIISVVYLDKTNQWMKLGVDRRETALKNIQTGYVQELSYRKNDSSFSGFQKRPSSTWLTAYVVKVFAMAFHMIHIEKTVLCEAVKWLILNKQKPDGHFQEDAQVYHGEMTGGIHESQDYSSLTAFVLIAIVEAKTACLNYVTCYEDSINKTVVYLERHIDGLNGTYAAVISAYALSLLGRNNERIVMKFASLDKSHWPVGESADSLYTIEATGYALLFFLQTKQHEKASKIVGWLSQRSEYGGGFTSTQATMVALQALARYKTDTPQFKEMNLAVTVTIPGRKNPLFWVLNQQTLLKSNTAKLDLLQNLSVTVRGKGQGTLKVFTTYYALLPDEPKECKHFSLTITPEELNNARQPEDAESTFLIKVCARYLGETPSPMAIMDISMLTGFSPDISDLDRLKNEIENYISGFELNKALSTTGSVIIYLDSVSNTEDTCIGFRVHQYYKVGFIQPASVKIYEYYDTTKSCTKFYNVPGNSTMLQKICLGDVCKCSVGRCMSLKTSEEDLERRVDISCTSGTEYVYKVTFLEKTKKESFINFKMKILTFIKLGSDQVNEEEIRQLITPVVCDDALKLELNKEYLIMGSSSDLWYTEGKVKYLVGESTWMEKWPNDAECQERKYRRLCEDLELFSENLRFHGCPY